METLSRLVSTFLLNAFWQVSLVTALTALAAHLFRNAAARYRHALWVIGLGLAILLPLTTLPETWRLACQVRPGWKGVAGRPRAPWSAACARGWTSGSAGSEPCWRNTGRKEPGRHEPLPAPGLASPSQPTDRVAALFRLRSAGHLRSLDLRPAHAPRMGVSECHTAPSRGSVAPTSSGPRRVGYAMPGGVGTANCFREQFVEFGRAGDGGVFQAGDRPAGENPRIQSLGRTDHRVMPRNGPCPPARLPGEPDLRIRPPAAGFSPRCLAAQAAHRGDPRTRVRRGRGWVARSARRSTPALWSTSRSPLRPEPRLSVPAIPWESSTPTSWRRGS